MDMEMYNGLDGKFKLRQNAHTYRVTVIFEQMDNFEAFFYWLEEMQRQLREECK